MGLLIFFIYLTILISTIVYTFPVGYLLTSSIFVICYSLLVCFSDRERLTDLGKCVFSFSILGIVYSLCVIIDVNIMSLF